jgi:hypothetical protein
MEEESRKQRKEKTIRINAYFATVAIASLISIGLSIPDYISDVIKTGKWNPRHQKNYYEDVNSSYNKLFENAASFEDSLKIYQENGFDINLTEPSFEEKERAYRKSLEGKTKLSS